uniref:Uncharacterized protein n=1 Tax=viral metagenome TaxID=1070528 RepID=A0A6C0D0H3_9ZZZZ
MRRRNEDIKIRYKSYFSLLPHPDYPLIDAPSPPPLHGEVKIGYMIFEPNHSSSTYGLYKFYELFSCCGGRLKRKKSQNVYAYQYTVYKLAP